MKMKFGLSQIKKKIPAIVKRIAVVCGSISAGISSYAYFVEHSPIMMKIGGIAFIISIVLPTLFGIDKDTKNEN
jgi:Na+/H+ antiporter NhaC